MPEPTPRAIDVGARNALARTLSPEYQGVREEHYLDITAEVMERADPDKLKTSLLGPEVKGNDVGWYLGPGARQPYLVAVTPKEALLMKGRIATLGERAVALTEASRQRPGRSLSDGDRAVIAGAGVRRLERPLAEMQGYTAALGQKFAIIAKFQEAAQPKHIGLARFGSEAKMREAFAFLQTFVFDEMFSVVGAQRQWNQQQATLARRTVTKRMFLERDDNQHIVYFRGLLDLAETWNGYKRAIVAKRIYDIKQYNRSHPVDEL
ncbi:MAG: hypothetical protein ABIV43_02630 [Candidatus Saccharimonadales bacterium]